MNKSIITCWYRITKDGPEFNHTSHGYNPLITEPIPTTVIQKSSWKGSKWEARQALLIDGKFVEENISEEELSELQN